MASDRVKVQRAVIGVQAGNTIKIAHRIIGCTASMARRTCTASHLVGNPFQSDNATATVLSVRKDLGIREEHTSKWTKENEGIVHNRQGYHQDSPMESTIASPEDDLRDELLELLQ
jgi:hypothetical protein